jgi:hypothetical protein
VNGNPINKKDPNGESPWDGLSGGVTFNEAQAASIIAAFWNWWNTPDPCMVAYLNSTRAGKLGSSTVGFFSLLSLTSVPWNITGNPSDSQMEYSVLPYKGAVVTEVANRMPWLPRLLGWFEHSAIGATAAATAINVYAYDKCGCKSPPGQ